MHGFYLYAGIAGGYPADINNQFVIIKAISLLGIYMRRGTVFGVDMENSDNQKLVKFNTSIHTMPVLLFLKVIPDWGN